MFELIRSRLLPSTTLGQSEILNCKLSCLIKCVLGRIKANMPLFGKIHRADKALSLSFGVDVHGRDRNAGFKSLDEIVGKANRTKVTINSRHGAARIFTNWIVGQFSEFISNVFKGSIVGIPLR